MIDRQHVVAIAAVDCQGIGRGAVERLDQGAVEEDFDIASAASDQDVVVAACCEDVYV